MRRTVAFLGLAVLSVLGAGILVLLLGRLSGDGDEVAQPDDSTSSTTTVTTEPPTSTTLAAETTTTTLGVTTTTAAATTTTTRGPTTTTTRGPTTTTTRRATTTTTTGPPSTMPVDCGTGSAEAKARLTGSAGAYRVVASVTNNLSKPIDLDTLAVRASYPDGRVVQYPANPGSFAGTRLQPGEVREFQFPESQTADAPSNIEVAEFSYHVADLPECRGT